MTIHRTITRRDRFAALPPLLFLVSGLVLGSPAVAVEPPESEEREPDATVQIADFSGTPDGLRAFVWEPATPPPHPAVVALHGSGGACFGEGLPCTADRITGKLQFYGKQLSDRGYLVVLVDSYTTRGVEECPASGPAPACPDPILVRPLDAHAGLEYVRGRPDVLPQRVGLIGWSQGGSATMSAVASSPTDGTVPPLVVEGAFSHPADLELMRDEGFFTAAMIYGGCGQQGHYNGVYENYGQLVIHIGADDASVDPNHCLDRETEALAASSDFTLYIYADEGHGYDHSNWSGVAAVQTRDRLWEQLATLTGVFEDGFESGDSSRWDSARGSS